MDYKFSVPIRLILIVLLPCSFSQSTITSVRSGITYGFFTALVDPYENFNTPGGAENVLTRNLNLLESLLKSLNLNSYQGRFVLVYPDYALTSAQIRENRNLARDMAQEPPELGVVPCNNFSNSEKSQKMASHRLSCMARDRQIYLVASLIESATCHNTTCPEDGVNLFATTLVFDSAGSLVARYRHGHLYGESALDVPATITPVSFNTSFGVRFGLLNGFDLMFEQPATALLEDGVTEFLVPYALQGALPFLTPLQILRGFQRSVSPTPINLLASCYNSPSSGYAGCGSFTPTLSASLFLSECSDDSTCYISLTANTTTFFSPYLDINFAQYNLSNFISQPLLYTPTADLNNIEVCHGRQCCTIQYGYASAPPEDSHYQMLVYDGVITPPNGSQQGWRVSVCGVVACSGVGVDTCADPPPEYITRTRFSVLHLESVFHTEMVLPTALQWGYEPFVPDMFDVSQFDQMHHAIRLSHFPQTPFSNVSVFALHSRNWEPVNEPNSLAAALASNRCFICLFTVLYSFF